MAERKDGKRSRTIDFAILLAVVSAIQASLPGVRDSIDPQVYGVIGMIIAVIVAILRVVTTQPLK